MEDTAAAYLDFDNLSDDFWSDHAEDWSFKTATYEEEDLRESEFSEDEDEIEVERVQELFRIQHQPISILRPRSADRDDSIPPSIHTKYTDDFCLKPSLPRLATAPPAVSPFLRIRHIVKRESPRSPIRMPPSPAKLEIGDSPMSELEITDISKLTLKSPSRKQLFSSKHQVYPLQILVQKMDTESQGDQNDEEEFNPYGIGLPCSQDFCKGLANFKCDQQVGKFKGCGATVCSAHSSAVNKVETRIVKPEEMRTLPRNQLRQVVTPYYNYWVVDEPVEMFRSCISCKTAMCKEAESRILQSEVKECCFKNILVAFLCALLILFFSTLDTETPSELKSQPAIDEGLIGQSLNATSLQQNMTTTEDANHGQSTGGFLQYEEAAP